MRINNSVSADFVFSTLLSTIITEDIGPQRTRVFAERSFAKYALVQEAYGTVDAFSTALQNSAAKIVLS